MPEPEEDSGLSCGSELSFVVVKLDEFLHTVDFLVHLGGNVAWVFFFPFPESDNLLSRSWGFAESNDEGSVFVDIEGQNSIRVWIEDGFFGGTGVDIPDDEHGIFSSVGSDDDIAFFVISGGRDLVTLGLRKGVRVLGVVFVGYFNSRR